MISVRFFLALVLILSMQENHFHAASSEIQEGEKKSASKIEDSPWNQKGDTLASFKTINEAEEYLQFLRKERQKLEGDFYGINITAYRYVHIFYPLGYIRYKIKKIDEEMRRVESEIEKLKAKPGICYPRKSDEPR